MLRTLLHASRWNSLRLFGNSLAAKSTIAVAVMGYLVLFNTYVVDYLTLNTAFCSGCDVSWRLYFLYFGSFFIAIGSGIYIIFCQSLIKRYAGASDFFDAEKAYFSQPGNLNYLFSLVEREKRAPAEDPLELRKTVVARNAALNADHVNTLAGIMGEHYVLQMYTYPALRVCVYLCYASGTLLLLVPTVYTFVEVFRSALLGVMNA